MIRITIERFCTHCMASGKEVPAVKSYTTEGGQEFLICADHEVNAIANVYVRYPVKGREVIHEE